MTAFNPFSHGSQDFYPTFLQVERRLSPQTVSLIAVIYNIGAICGGILFGSLSERFGRRRCIVAASILSPIVMPLWAFSTSVTLLAFGAFLMQFAVQGALGIIPVHLNELSPLAQEKRSPASSIGSAICSLRSAPRASALGGNYAIALVAVVAPVAIIIAIVAALGSEAKGVQFAVAATSATAAPVRSIRGAGERGYSGSGSPTPQRQPAIGLLLSRAWLRAPLAGHGARCLCSVTKPPTSRDLHRLIPE